MVSPHLDRVRLAEIVQSIQVSETPLTEHPRKAKPTKVRVFFRYPVFHVISHSLFGPMSYHTGVK